MNLVLKDIVEEAYVLFGHYQVSDHLDACTDCCMTPEQEEAMRSMKVRELPFELMYEYNTAATTEKPSIVEFKHFLPRFLELTASFQFVHHSLELVLRRFKYYNKPDWTSEEQLLIEKFGINFFKQSLNTYPIPDNESLMSVIVMLDTMYMETDKLLLLWQKSNSSSSILHFHDLVTSISGKRKDKLSNSFSNQTLDSILIEWANDKVTRHLFANRIEQLIMESTEFDESILQELSWTYDLITLPQTNY